MIIKKLILQNIRSYVKEQISFPDASVLLKGDIGAGKSTILYAIEFALFGLTNNLTYKMLLRNGTSEGKIILELYHKNKEIRIIRTIKKTATRTTQTNVKIIINNIEKEMTDREAKAFVLKMLNYPLELINSKTLSIYRYTIYTPQENMKEILLAKIEERLKVIRKIFNIDKYETIRENLKKLIRELKYKIKLYNEKTSELDHLKKQNSEIAIELQNMRNKQKTLLFTEREKKEKIKQLKLSYEKIRDEIEKINRIKVELLNEKEKKEIIQKEIDKYKQIINENEKQRTEFFKNLDELNNKIKEIRINKQKEEIEREIKEKREFIEKKSQIIYLLENQHKEKQTKLDYINNILKKEDELLKQKRTIDENLKKENILIKQKKDIEKEIEELENAKNEIKNKFITLKTEIKKKQETLNQISTLKKCPLCLQEISKEHKEKINQEYTQFININVKYLENYENDEKNIIKEIEKNKETIKEIEKNLNTLQIQKYKKNQINNQLNEINENKNIKNELISNLNKLNKQLRANKAIDFEGIKNEIDQLEKEKDQLNIREKLEIKIDIITKTLENKEKEIKDKIMQISEKEQTIAKIQKRITELQTMINEDTFRSLSNKEKETKEQITIEENKYLEINKKLSEIMANIKNYETQNNEILQKINDLEDLKRKQEIITRFNNYLHEQFIPLTQNIEEHLRIQILREFDEYYRIWFDKLIDNELMTTRLDSEFSPIIEQNGYETDFDYLSGGEKTSCSLAYRLALNKVVSDHFNLKNNIIILDEPTDGFSYEQLDKVKEVLNDLSYSQIIIVSHENKIESFVEHVIKIEKINGESKVKNEF